MEFSRQPRLMPEYPIGEIDITSPEPIGEKPEIHWFQTFIMPLAMIFVTVLVYMLGQSGAGGGFMGSPVFLISSIAMTGLMIIGSLISLNHQFNKHKRLKKRRNKLYKAYISEKDSELKLAAEQQAKALRQLNLSPDECIERMNTNPTPACPTDPRLWERTPGFNDFLSFRLGIGTVQASLRVRDAHAPSLMETDLLMNEPRTLSLKYEKVRDVPVCVDLRSAQICGIVGAKDRTNALVNNILIQLVANHGYDNVRIVMLAKNDTFSLWQWSRFLPHLWNEGFTARRVICGKDTAKLTLDEIHAELKEREKKGDDVVFSMYYVFIVEAPEIIEDSPIRKFIYEPHGRLGVTAIFTAEHTAFLPANCGAIVTLKEKTGEVIDRVKNEKNIFTPDQATNASLENAARKISPLRIKSNDSSFSLPRSITLCQMSGENDLTKVNVLSNWANRRTYNGMDVPIGARAGGELFRFDIHDDVGYGGHGPHGLVAGTTGSGKSELLQSVIISLAMSFHPHDIVFVLIDYKGGGMADVFKGMPHLAGIITNLGGAQTTRAMLSLNSEIKRRQARLAEYGVNHIDKYQRIYYSENRPPQMEPMPHLAMIADEFAELYHEQRDFINELVSAARVGRSLGIHLVLATQKPDGVVDDQIWSNSKFKMCLKVQTEADSNGVLKKPDAAFIREPGRTYIQIGNDEIYELIQSAYSGADYTFDTLGKDENARREKNIYRLSVDGRQTKIYPKIGSERPTNENKPKSQLEAMVAHIAESSASLGIKPLDGPWADPLEEIVYINEIPDKWLAEATGILTAVVGIVDDPRSQRKFALELDFATEGGLLVYGAAGTGKTTLLKSICLSLAQRYTPDQVNIYIMDMGGAALRLFAGLPHCGGVLTVDQERNIRQFVRFLFRTIEKRKQIFEENHVEGFVESVQGGLGLPAVVVMIDGYAPLAELYDDVDEQLILLARDAARYGIYLIITGMSTRDIRYKLSTNFKMAVTFELIDKSYAEIVGRTEGVEPESYCGRGLVKLEKPLEFQAVLPEHRKKIIAPVTEMLNGEEVTRQSERDEVISTREIIDELSANETRRAIPIPVMPACVDINVLNAENTKGQGLWIGLNDSDLVPVVLNFAEHTSFMVTGSAGCGKSTVATAWLKNMDNSLIYALDSSGAGFITLLERENVTDLAGVDMESFVSEMENLLDERRKAVIDARKSGKDLETVVSQWKQIILAFDRFSEVTDDDDTYYELCKLLTRIIKKEQGMKVSVFALDTLDGFSDDYSDAAKALKSEQTGLLLGSLKDQPIFGVSFPYGTPEKEFMPADGYIIKKSKYIGVRAAV
ncbi:MAG: type VII secretion protein EssC [Defluviitaleaceae bacterium]|nr:type VII secretion protein EssC [Defluviitaleaceae bacterium]